jgi:hypothetical protein
MVCKCKVASSASHTLAISCTTCVRMHMNANAQQQQHEGTSSPRSRRPSHANVGVSINNSSHHNSSKQQPPSLAALKGAPASRTIGNGLGSPSSGNTTGSTYIAPASADKILAHLGVSSALYNCYCNCMTVTV